jgi:shikimate dehydrogenase
MADSKTAIFGILGYPVRHSFSPAMHNAAFKYLNINARYEVFEKQPQEIEAFLQSLAQQNICGLNVTIPYKEKVLNFVKLDRESFYAQKLQAVNTIVVKDNVLKGFNTDKPGFSRHLKENFDPLNKNTAILGAGGAARAVAYVLAESKAKNIDIYDVDTDKSKSIVSLIKEIFSNFNIQAVKKIEDLKIKEKDLLVNATPIGMKEIDPCLVKEEMLHKELFIYDLIYNPPETKLLALAKKIGAKYSNGLGMLLYQGAISFKHFTEKDAPVEIMRQALIKELEKCRKP